MGPGGGIMNRFFKTRQKTTSDPQIRHVIDQSRTNTSLVARSVLYKPASVARYSCNIIRRICTRNARVLRTHSLTAA